MSTGFDAQIGLAAESTWGTAVTVTRFFPYVSDSISQEIDRLESAGQIAGQRLIRSQQWSAGNIGVSGDVAFELWDASVGLVFKHALGTNVTTGAGPYLHTMSAGPLNGLGLTIQKALTGSDGTVRTFTYAGCKIGSWELACRVGEIATFGITVTGKSEVTNVALASASYASNIRPMTYVGGSVTVAGSATGVNCPGFTISGDNKLGERRFIGSQNQAEPLEGGEKREITGTVDLEFVDLTQYNRFVNGTEAAMVFTLAAGTASAVGTFNARFDGTTPVRDGTTWPHVLSVPFKAVGATTDAGAFSFVLTNGDATV